jgi:ectoine hydroxylase-related dioxygenase (phytanoyl-CoA dioxygenase family)
VVWHQDCVIAVAERNEVNGWGPWSIKDGVHHARPSSELMSRMLAIRIHVDDCGSDNGPLRVIPSSHKQGFLSDREIQEYPKDGAVTCLASRGEALLMRPLLLHSSSAAKSPNTRRVVHLEFAADELPCRLTWRDRV